MNTTNSFTCYIYCLIWSLANPSQKMKAFLLAAVALAYFAYSLAQPPPFPIQRCYESPDAWSGNILVADYARKRSDFGYIFYNRTKQWLHFTYNAEFEDGRDYIKKWYFYDTRKSYTLDEDAHTCTEEDIPPDEQFPLFSAPRDAIFRHIDRYGSFIPNLGVTTDYFRMDTDNGGVFHGYYAPAYDESRICVPVIESYENIDTAPTHQRNTHFTYMNITTFPYSNLVWEVPGECFH